MYNFHDPRENVFAFCVHASDCKLLAYGSVSNAWHTSNIDDALLRFSDYYTNSVAWHM